jgi:hypothetical protein
VISYNAGLPDEVIRERQISIGVRDEHARQCHRWAPAPMVMPEFPDEPICRAVVERRIAAMRAAKEAAWNAGRLYSF